MMMIFMVIHGELLNQISSVRNVLHFDSIVVMRYRYSFRYCYCSEKF